MSYILDALKRADAERGRGAVPGLHAQPLPGRSPSAMGASHRPRWWPWVALALTLGAALAGVLVWRGLTGEARAPVVLSAAAQAPRAEPPPPAPAPLVTPVAPQAMAAPLVTAPPPAPPVARSQVHAGAAPKTAAASAPQPVAKPAAPSTPAPVAPAAPVASASTAPLVAPPASAAAPAPVPLLSELPEALRRPIPALTITGAVYSENPAQRLLLVNGQVLGQGAAAAPEVMIEEIRARSSTFNFRGSRFRVTY